MGNSELKIIKRNGDVVDFQMEKIVKELGKLIQN